MLVAEPLIYCVLVVVAQARRARDEESYRAYQR